MTSVALEHNKNYVSQFTGRRRKLSDGAMIDICHQFAEGKRVKALADMYGVSEGTIYSITYWTPRKPQQSAEK